MENCPCGSSNTYAACCEPIITGNQPAETAEQLMRARYSAHVMAELDFLYDSTHPAHREGYDSQATRDWSENSEWLGLEIVETSDGTTQDETGEVEFIARFRDQSGIHRHHERGRFKRENRQWLFTEGIMVKSQPISVTKVGRNDPCPCGSGKKYKKCCG